MFAFAAIYHAIQWWLSRAERLLLVFAVKCAADAAFCVTAFRLSSATSTSDAQVALDSFMTIGMIGHALVLHFYATLGARRDFVFRIVVTGAIGFLVVLNQFTPLRGTVIGLRQAHLLAGLTGTTAIRAGGSCLPLVFAASFAVQGYGFVVARTLWKRDRAGAVLVGIAAAGMTAGVTSGALIDFAHVRAPYIGAVPHALFVVAMAVQLAREYSARGARVIATERQFESVFEHSPIGKALLEPNGEIRRVNRALCRVLGATPAELCAMNFYDLTRDEQSEDTDLTRLFAGEVGGYTVERRILRKGGDAMWTLLSVSVVKDHVGRPTQLVAQFQDVTELRTHREQLEELVATRTRELRDAKNGAERASEAKSQFLAHISHEIRTPLNVILGYAQLLEGDQGLGDARQRKVGVVLSSGRHLVALVNDVLEMSKIEAGRTELVEGPLDLGGILDEIERMFAMQTADKGIDLIVERDAELPGNMVGDVAKVKQILINLTHNAVKFTQRGSIRVAAMTNALADGRIGVTVVVTDTGVGIAPGDVERIFQPFERLDAGAGIGGTGLGLSISSAHARLMGGDLRVESTPGIGSRFTFTFIAKRGTSIEATDGVAKSRGAPRRTTRHKVLIVDDVEVNRDLLAELLAAPGFETRTAVDGRDALSVHDAWRPDVVLMDLRMPGMSGLEAIRLLRASGSRARIGVLSASALGSDEREALAGGADFFIRKPIDVREVVAHVTRTDADSPRRSEA